MPEIGRQRKIIRPEDIVTIGFLVCLTLVLLVRYQKVASLETYLLKHLVIVGLYLFILGAHNRRRSGITSFARHWYPVFLLPIVYRELEPIIHIIVDNKLDHVFKELDFALFGCQPCLWLEGIINPWLTEILQISYTTYFYFPTFLGI